MSLVAGLCQCQAIGSSWVPKVRSLSGTRRCLKPGLTNSVTTSLWEYVTTVVSRLRGPSLSPRDNRTNELCEYRPAREYVSTEDRKSREDWPISSIWIYPEFVSRLPRGVSISKSASKDVSAGVR